MGEMEVRCCKGEGDRRGAEMKMRKCWGDEDDGGEVLRGMKVMNGR